MCSFAGPKSSSKNLVKKQRVTIIINDFVSEIIKNKREIRIMILTGGEKMVYCVITNRKEKSLNCLICSKKLHADFYQTSHVRFQNFKRVANIFNNNQRKD